MLIEELTQEEARVLGTLIEKSLATPDYYPLTLNSLRTACNQKSSRDPVTEYDDATVSIALAGLKRKCLVTFIPYGSSGTTYKYRHFLEDLRFNLEKPDMAVLSVLLLRGAQTLNEIKLRAASMHPMDSLEAAEAVLKGFAERPEPLAELLAKRPGWKEPRWRDTVRAHVDATGVQGRGSDETEAGPADLAAMESLRPGSLASTPPRSAREEIDALKAEVAELRASLEALQADVGKIRNELGG